ncbi:MAG: MBL fold metallo-hydrolase [Candidatus Aminicenantes bacterium]|nr:MBL fold metallo-hydrolase [Candidatus Aminicenantes bacterium]
MKIKFLASAGQWSTFLIASLIIIYFTPSNSQQISELPPIEIKKIRGNVYEITGGSGANAGLIIGEKGYFLIDAKMNPQSAREMLQVIAQMTTLPLQAVILTHSDGDHVNGLPGLPEKTTVIAHENTYQEMKQVTTEGPLLNYLPSITYKQELILRSGKTTIHLYHFGPGHTSGDSIIYIPEEKVAFLGDLVFIGRDPLIHRHKGGNSFGVVKILEEVLKLDATSFIHGHGEVIDRTSVEKAIAALKARQEQIKALIEQGKSLEEIKTILQVKEPPDVPGRPKRPTLVEIIYLELTEKR